MIKQLWESFSQSLGRAARIGLIAGALGIILATALVGYWLLRTDYQVLFADLTPQDTAAMTAELDRLKMPYVLSDQGNNVASILVDKNEVHKTRIKLMGKDIPLHGAVGFELFNNSDFGMTEFAQKINYQRALQGELTRTILSLAEIKDARVLLALPEQGLFKQASNKPKASITVTMKQGKWLRPEQVTGMQRLVSAAVPGIIAADVTIVDQSGVALTRSAGDADSELGSGSSRLDLKKETESYLAKKAGQVLERALGPGMAMASVDVTLDMDRVQSNTDEILSAPGKSDEAPAGVVVRERQTSRDAEQSLNARAHPESGSASPSGSSQTEFEYAVGHRVEQVIGQPGSIRRIQVAVVVNKPLSDQQQEQLRSMIAASVGASSERGDLVVLQSLESLNAPATARNSKSEQSGNPEEPESKSSSSYSSSEQRNSIPWKSVVAPGMALVFLLVFAWFLYARSQWKEGGKKPKGMTEAQRQTALAQVQSWMRGHREGAGSTRAPIRPGSFPGGPS